VDKTENDDKKLIFYGLLTNEYAPPEGDDCYSCRVCKKHIIFDGIHVRGWVGNPAVHEREIAEWRTEALWGKVWPGDEGILSKENIPIGIPVDFFCHDYHCLSLFLRNKVPINPSLQAYAENEPDDTNWLDSSDWIPKETKNLRKNDQDKLAPPAE